MRSVLLLVLVAACCAHPRNGRGNRRREKGFAPCLDVRPSEPHRDALKSCVSQLRRGMRGNRGSLDAGMNEEAMAEMSSCLVDRLGLQLEDGSLDTAKLEQGASVMQGDLHDVAQSRLIVRDCIANNTGTNATQQMADIHTCMKAGGAAFCEEVVAMVETFAAEEAGSCTSVTVSDQVMTALSECQTELGTTEEPTPARRGPGGRRGGRGRGRGRGRGGRSRRHNHKHDDDDDNQMWAVLLCVDEKMGWYNNETGFDFPALAEHVGSFAGWDAIPEAQSNVTAAIEGCAVEFGGDAMLQATEWANCFMPTYIETCGFNNNLTEFFFPGLLDELSEASVEGLLRGGPDSSEEDSGEDDTEMVDAGLMALFGAEEEAVVLEGVRVARQAVKRRGSNKRLRNRKKSSEESKEDSNTSESLESDETVDYPDATTAPPPIVP